MEEVRRRCGCSLRSLARRVPTSHATLIAYSSSKVDPGVGTLNRVVRAAGFAIDGRLTTRVLEVGGLARGEELDAALRLAEQFPRRAPGPLSFPSMGGR